MKSLIKLTEVSSKLSFTAVLAELLYIIYRCTLPVCTIDDLRFMGAVPEMVELLLLTVAVTVAFMALAAYIEVKNQEGK